MITISARQFRDNQEAYLDKAAKGVEILIRRHNQTFKLVPVVDDTLMTKEEFFAMLDRGMDDVKQGKAHTYDPKKGLDNFINSLDKATKGIKKLLESTKT